MDARQSPRTELGWLAPFLKGTMVKKACVGNLYGIEESYQHGTHALDQYRQLFQHFPTTQLLGITHDHLHPQHTLVLVVNLQGQVAPLDFEHRQIVAWCTDGFDHLRPASPL